MLSKQDPLLDAIPWPSVRAKFTARRSTCATLRATLDAQLVQSTRLRQAVLKRAFEGRLVGMLDLGPNVWHQRAISH